MHAYPAQSRVFSLSLFSEYVLGISVSQLCLPPVVSRPPRPPSLGLLSLPTANFPCRPVRPARWLTRTGTFFCFSLPACPAPCAPPLSLPYRSEYIVHTYARTYILDWVSVSRIALRKVACGRPHTSTQTHSLKRSHTSSAHTPRRPPRDHPGRFPNACSRLQLTS